jgi:hypothetical protein
MGINTEVDPSLKNNCFGTDVADLRFGDLDHEDG